jgi:hypothetical protein
MIAGHAYTYAWMTPSLYAKSSMTMTATGCNQYYPTAAAPPILIPSPHGLAINIIFHWYLHHLHKISRLQLIPLA